MSDSVFTSFTGKGKKYKKINNKPLKNGRLMCCLQNTSKGVLGKYAFCKQDIKKYLTEIKIKGNK